MSGRALVVDLDGSLISTDLLHESTLQLLRSRPFDLFGLCGKLLHGPASVKQFVAQRTEIAPETLPYNQELLVWLREQRAEGRHLVLCTASHETFAHAVAAHLDLFDEVLASDAKSNLKGKNKAAALKEKFGSGGYDYVGDSTADLPVWAEARQAIVMGDSHLARRARSVCEDVREMPVARAGLLAWLRQLRVQQWLKNLLLFAPFLAAHRWQEPDAWLVLLSAFLAFGLCASGTYLFNDLLDIESDRLHPRKQARGLASGKVSVVAAVVVCPLLLLFGLAMGALVNVIFLGCLAAYLVLTVSYSLWLKRLILLDCLTLALLYTLRIIAGAAALQMGVSFWLLAFSAFLFLSLAFVKRYAEMEVQLKAGRDFLHGRGYLTADLPLVLTLGVSAGYLAVLVLALYLNSEEVLLLYRTPEIVWGAVLVLLYWVSWIWLQAHRGGMHDDPLVFAIKDKTSLVAGVVFLAVVYLGTLGW